MGNVVQWDAIDYLGTRRIDHSNLRLGCGAERRGVRIYVRDIQTPSIRRRRDVACAASGCQPLFFQAGLGIQHGYIV